MACDTCFALASDSRLRAPWRAPASLEEPDGLREVARNLAGIGLGDRASGGCLAQSSSLAQGRLHCAAFTRISAGLSELDCGSSRLIELVGCLSNTIGLLIGIAPVCPLTPRLALGLEVPGKRARLASICHTPWCCQVSVSLLIDQSGSRGGALTRSSARLLLKVWGVCQHAVPLRGFRIQKGLCESGCVVSRSPAGCNLRLDGPLQTLPLGECSWTSRTWHRERSHRP